MTEIAYRDWLGDFSRRYYYGPSLALWRALEARTLGEEVLRSPSLDVGAYDGSFAATWLGDRPPIDVGIDLEPRESADTDRAYRALIRASAETLPFDDRAFATIVCNSVLEHVEDDVRALSEFARVLQRDGALLLTTPSVYLHDYLWGVRRARRRGDETAARAYAEATDQRLMHIRYRRLDEWERLLDRAGFNVVDAAYYLPQSATAFWDIVDRWITEPLGGRPIYQWLASSAMRRIGAAHLGARLTYRILAAHYRRAVQEQDGTRVPGASLMLRARRR
jgi:SAM-dependent methyltransferase